MDNTFAILSGLTWLEGRTDVMVFGDGALQGPFTVTGGEIALTTPICCGYVGVPYSGEIRQLPHDGGLNGQQARNVTRNLERVSLEYTGFGQDIAVLSDYDNLGDGSIGGSMPLVNRIVQDGLGVAAAPRYRFLDTEITGEWSQLSHIRVRAQPGLPLQVHAIEKTVRANG